jgi:hypothetical protein
MADTITVKLDGGVRLARVMLAVMGLGGICVFTRPDALHIFAGLCVMGTFWGIPIWVHALTPKTLDAQGLTCGFGRRFLWSDLEDVRVIAQKRGTRTVNHRFELKFKSGQARFGYNQVANAKEVVAFLERIAQRPLLPT